MSEPPTPAPPPPPAGAPKPTTLIAGVIIAAVIVYNLHLDVGSDSYDGSKLTYGLSIGLLSLLGVDLIRIWRDR